MGNMTDEKRPVQTVDGSPKKRLFWSIISDYDLKTALCELIDNALDQWLLDKTGPLLAISLDLDVDRKVILVKDNAGGVKLDDLNLLIAPGGSRNDPLAEVIGVFGVGGKRAAIALAENIEIKTRHENGRTHELDITRQWIESDDWRLPAYEIPDIGERSTEIHLSYLRKPMAEADVDDLRVHIGMTYSSYIKQGCTIQLNGDDVAPIEFEAWAFPPGHAPRRVIYDIDLADVGRFNLDVTAGLIRDRDRESANYGVYFYCNQRLVVKELKTRDVGYFISAEAGVPHSDSSMCRTIVRLQGPAKGMPWTSNKTGINFDHPIFRRISKTIIDLNAHFTRLSRRFKKDWPNNVVRYDEGDIEIQPAEQVTDAGHLWLPELPKDRRPRGARNRAANRQQTERQPWTVGLVEALDAIDVIERQNLDTKNRFALILLDSNFEIALKEYIVNRPQLFPPHEFTNAKLSVLFERRTEVVKTVRAKVAIPDELVEKANYYYSVRNSLIHQRATANPTDADIRGYRTVVQQLLNILFDIQFDA
jgi:histidine kinase/DNA gyrase B/HSP90-like ATPase